ncbi:acyltransferase family protein [Kocuria sp. CPCC 205231]|uniref:acyltransferase family protein n=1 Tax=Kocuria sp. CPCC 205231 TaxID=3073551 RepID=UPI0034D6F9C2
MVTLTPMAPASAGPRKSGFRSDIQGLRAIAVLLVVFYHAGITTLSGGYVGVDVFFVISGFLITTHLLESLQKDGHIRLGAFYAKRARRILPAAFTVLLLTVAAAVMWMPPLQLEAVYKGAAATALYVPNMLFAREGTNYLAETAPSVFQHYWSLGIEEQFYLVWPLLLMLIFRALKSEKRMLWAVGVLVVTSFVLCVATMSVSQPWAFFSLPTRAWELGVGALIAFVMRAHTDRLAALRSGILAWLGLAGLLVVAFAYDSSTPFPSYFAAAPVLATALVIIGGVGRAGPARLLSTRPMQFIGLISYSLYLVHWPLLVIPQSVAGLNDPLPLWATLGLGAASFPLAYLLYRFVEDPARKAKLLFGASPRRSLLAVAGSSGLIVVLVGVSMIFTQRVPLHMDRVAAVAPLVQGPVGTKFVPANLAPGLRAASEDIPAIYGDGCHRSYESADAAPCRFGTESDAPVVALFGDSHAASWFPSLNAMAEKGRIRLDVYTKTGCHSARLPTHLDGALYESCMKWRSGVIDLIRSAKPDVIVLANYSDRYQQTGMVDPENAWSNGLADTIQSLPEESQVSVLADVPDMGHSPSICLSAHLQDTQDCSRPRENAFNTKLLQAEKATVETVGAQYRDLTPYLCNHEVCPPVIGNQLVYRDAHHLTATFGESLEEPLGQELGLPLR